MGQQQLLLLVLGAIIVGVAIVVGINMFSSGAISASVDAVTNDCLAIASRAQEYYRKPAALGGGGRTFTGLNFALLGYGSGATYINGNGTYTISNVAAQTFNLAGVTFEKDNNDATWTVTYTGIGPNNFGSVTKAATAAP